MSPVRGARITDLHSYTIRDGLMGEWIEAWRSEVLPLRLDYGFQFRGACVDEERSRFTWVFTSEADDERERTRSYWTAQAMSGVNPLDYIVEHRIHTVPEIIRERIYL